jgi:hypothetical protein
MNKILSKAVKMKWWWMDILWKIPSRDIDIDF